MFSVDQYLIESGAYIIVFVASIPKIKNIFRAEVSKILVPTFKKLQWSNSITHSFQTHREDGPVLLQLV